MCDTSLFHLEDLPSPKDEASLGNCSPEAYYYGIGVSRGTLSKPGNAPICGSSTQRWQKARPYFLEMLSHS